MKEKNKPLQNTLPHSRLKLPNQISCEHDPGMGMRLKTTFHPGILGVCQNFQHLKKMYTQFLA